MSDDLETIKSRDLLDVALGVKKVDDLNIKGTGTFLDLLPKDIIEYLYHYTGPMDCLYLTNIIYDASGRRIPEFHVWVNKTQQEVSSYAQRNGYYNNQITKAQVFFMEGKPYLIQPIEKRKLYGMPVPSKPKKLKVGGSSNMKKRCSCKTKSGKRCKAKTSNASGKCTVHDTV